VLWLVVVMWYKCEWEEEACATADYLYSSAAVIVRAANAAGAVGVRPGCDGSHVLPLVQARQLLHRVIVDHRILPCAPGHGRGGGSGLSFSVWRPMGRRRQRDKGCGGDGTAAAAVTEAGDETAQEEEQGWQRPPRYRGKGR
jgi:hypothetical protein